MKKTEAGRSNLLKKVVRHDLKCGRLYTWCMFLLPLVLIVFSCFFLQRDVIRMTADGRMSGNASFADYLFRFMEGMPVFVSGQVGSQFKIPAVWLLFHWWISYLAGAYAVKDLKTQGANILLRVRSRKLWWIGKCIWVNANVIFYYLFLIIVIWIFAAISGNQSLILTPVLHNLSADMAGKLSGASLLIVGILLPVLISAGMTLIQLSVTIWTSQTVGNIIVLVTLILSAYICAPLLPGNYLMLLRSSSVMGKEGVSAGYGVLAALVMIAAAIMTGVWRFEKYDVK